MKQDNPHKSAHLEEIDAFYTQKLASLEKGAPVASLLSPDYDPAALPDDLLGASFGCGNPLAFSNVEPGDTVLDLGCGAGLDLIIAAEKVGPAGKVIGLDMSDEMVERARANILARGLENVDAVKGTIEALPFEDQSVDWVVSNCVINLSRDKHAVFSEINRVLKPGGRLLVSDIVAHDLPDWIGMHADLYAACVSSAVPEKTYLGLAADAGLSHLKVIDEMVYDEAALKHLIREELPVALAELAKRLGLSPEVMLEKAVADLSGKIKSIKLFGARPA